MRHITKPGCFLAGVNKGEKETCHRRKNLLEDRGNRVIPCSKLGFVGSYTCCGTPAQPWIYYVHMEHLLLESLLLTARVAPNSLSTYRPALLVLELMSLGLGQ